MGVLPKRRWLTVIPPDFLESYAEVALGIHVGVVADDLDGVLVCTDGTVGAEAVELATDRAFAERRSHLLGDVRGSVQ